MTPGSVEIRVLVEVVVEIRRESVMVVVDIEEVEGRLGRNDEVVALVRVKMQWKVDNTNIQSQSSHFPSLIIHLFSTHALHCLCVVNALTSLPLSLCIFTFPHTFHVNRSGAWTENPSTVSFRRTHLPLHLANNYPPSLRYNYPHHFFTLQFLDHLHKDQQ